MTRLRTAAVATAALGLVALPSSAAASGVDHGDDDGGGGISTVATGLDGIRQLAAYQGHRLVVAESDTGEVSAVDRRTGETTTLVSGLASPQGVAYDDGRLYVAVGGPPPPGKSAPPLPVGAVLSSLLVYDTDGMWLRTVGLAAHELAHNPDGQRQFGPDGAPVGVLSDPVAVYADEDRVLVADAGANAVLEVNARTGDVSTFFVPPVVTPEEVAGCDRPGNDPGTVGCDPVPAGVTEGEDGLVYVSTLGAGVQGAGRVYVLNQLGHEVRRLEGFTSPTGIAVDCEGVVTVSELLEGLPAGQPGPGFDPSTVGQVVRVGRIGDRTYAQVTMPTGLVIEDGQLYASAWSGGSVMVPPAGQVVRVGADTFGPLPAQ